MVFSSPIFLFVFLPAVFLVSRLCRSVRAQNVLLALASVVFYAFGQLQYVPLFVLSVAVNFLAGLWFQSGRGGKKAVLALAVALNLGILGVFKYTDFLIQNANALFGLSLPLTGIVLPIGISFYTFQGLSYTIDCYREPTSGTRSFGKLFLYIAFFPQLIAGPIVKYHDIAAQIDSRVCTPAQAEQGLLRFLRGLGKKLLIADAVGYMADAAFNAGAGDAALAWLGALCYTLQIYYDFSGYSDMAIGMGRMFGFTFLENFRFPYAAASIREFWRGWHISLSSWFREYLYIPLGGNRRGKARAALNRFLVFLCTGIWHGANWTFVLWGLGHGLLSSLEGAGLIPAERLQKCPAGRLLCRVYTMLMVMLLFVLFRAESVGAALGMFGAMFRFRRSAEGALLLARLLSPAAVLVLLLALLCAGSLIPRLRAARPAAGAKALWLQRALGLALLVLSVLSLAQGGFHPFIYFQF